ncbi:MAG: beta-ketoacyl-ACP synthase III [Thermodesulfobacteriota bacterium]|nr:beta-ketoacyl-ACP synthase III [Thermodesulfobacteriota bacterium]
MKSIRIVGTGSSVPENIVTNHDLEERLDTTDEWIVQRTGIRERRIADPDKNTSDLAQEASMRALDQAGMTPEELDLIILATITPDTCCPASSNWLQGKLGATNAVSFDVTAACSGFLFGLSIAEQYMKNGQYKTALVVGAEVLSRSTNWKDRTSCILWADAAGAAVLRRSQQGSALLSTHIHSDGTAGDSLLLPGGGSSTTPITPESAEKGVHFLKLNQANRTFKVAVKRFAEAIEEAAAHNGCSVSDIDVIIPHQANLRILRAFAERLKVPWEKVFVNVDRYGNSSAATVPLALDQAVRSGKIQSGHKVILAAFGGGLTWASALVDWQ